MGQATTGICNSPDGQVLALKVRDGLHHAVHADHLTAAQVQGLLEVGLGDAQNAFYTVINVCEAPGLLAITPHLYVLGRGQHLAAEGCWSLFSATFPRSIWTIDVVEPDAVSCYQRPEVAV